MGKLDPMSSNELERALQNPKSRLGRYVVLDVLGQGGMGMVFKAYDPDNERLVALKQALEVRRKSNRLARFAREGRIAAKLVHPNIARVYEAVERGRGAPYLVMELVPGRSLTELLEDEPLSNARSAQILLEVCQAMAYAHEQGVVHRDLKPQNIQIAASDGRAVVLDFGLAKDVEDHTQSLTRSGQLLGTMAYMAPEQVAAAKHAGPQADVYALGAILFECLTGEAPFEADSAIELLDSIQHQAPRSLRSMRPDIHPVLEELVEACLAKDPEDRPQGAQALVDALERFLSGETAAPVRRGSRALLLGLTAVVLGLAAVLGVLLSRDGSSSGGPAESTPAWLTAFRTGVDAAVLSELERFSDPAPDRSREVGFLERAIQEAPPAERSLALGLQALWGRRALGEALGHLDAALEQDASSFPALALRGVVRQDIGKAKQIRGAEADFTAALALRPTMQLLHAHRGRIRVRLRKLKGARADLERAIAIEPTKWNLMFRGIARLLSGDPEGAAADYEQVIRIAPSFAPIYGARAAVRHQQGDQRGSLADYTRAIELGGKPMLMGAWYVNRSQAWLDAKDLDRALTDAEQAVKQRPKWFEAHHNLATVYKQRGDIDQALAAFARSIDLRRTASSLHGRAMCWMKKQSWTRALEDLNAAIALDPESSSLFALRGTLRRDVKRDHAGSLADYDEAIRLRPKTARWHLGRAFTHKAKGDLQACALDLERSLGLDPKQQNADKLRQFIAKTLGRPSKH